MKSYGLVVLVIFITALSLAGGPQDFQKGPKNQSSRSVNYFAKNKNIKNVEELRKIFIKKILILVVMATLKKRKRVVICQAMWLGVQ